MLKIVFVVLLLLIVVSDRQAIGQIPASGADIPSLLHLRWGMTIEEAKSVLARKYDLRTPSDTTITYQDILFESGVKIKLQFRKTETRQAILKSINAEVSNTQLQETILKHLTKRFGEPHDTQKKRETKLFVSIDMEVKRWELENENVLLAVLLRGGKIISLNLAYLSSKNSSVHN